MGKMISEISSLGGVFMGLLYMISMGDILREDLNFLAR